MAVIQQVTASLMYVVLFVFYSDKYDFNNYNHLKLGREIKSKNNCEIAKVVMKRAMTQDFEKRLVTISSLNAVREINAQITLDFTKTIIENIVMNARWYLMYTIEVVFKSLIQKMGNDFKAKYIKDNNAKYSAYYAISDASVGVSLLAKIRAEAKAEGESRFKDLRDDYLEGKYNKEEDYYSDDEYGIPRYNRSRAYIGRAKKLEEKERIKRGLGWEGSSSSGSWGDQVQEKELDLEKKKEDEL
jgi:hypothetical protein